MIYIDLSKITFDNDLFLITLNYPNVLVLNRIDEYFTTKNGKEVLLNCIHLTYNKQTVSNRIGVKNGKFLITTTEPSLIGTTLTQDSMKFCTLEFDNA